MKYTIRHERPEDFYIVKRVAREAFWNLYCPGCNEHFIIHPLRTHPDYIAELSFVIETDDGIVGSIFYSRSKVISSEGKEWDTITFGPVRILPQYHRQGYGRAIIIGGYPSASSILDYLAIFLNCIAIHFLAIFRWLVLLFPFCLYVNL